MTPRSLKKMAEELEAPSPYATLGKSVLGLTLGMGLGYGGLQLADSFSKLLGYPGLPKNKLRYAVPILASALGSAAPYLHQRTQEKMREGHIAKQKAKYEKAQQREKAV